MNTRTLFVFLILAAMLSCNAPAQDWHPAYRDSVNRFAESRNSIATYAVLIKGVVYTRNQESSSGLSHAELLRFSAEIASDNTRKRTVIILNREPMAPATSLELSSRVFLIDGLVAKELVGDRYRVLQSVNEIPICNPMTIGATFCPGVMNWKPLSETIEGLQSWTRDTGDREVNSKAGKLTVLSPGASPETPRSKITFSTAGGYLPTEMLMCNGSKKKVDLRGKLRKVGQHWVPEQFACFCGSTRFVKLEFDWIAVNEPLPEGVFNEHVLQFMTGESESLNPEEPK